MEKTSLYNHISEINDEWIIEAAPSFGNEGAVVDEPKNKTIKRNMIIFAISMIVCLSLVVAGVTLTTNNSSNNNESPSSITETEEYYTYKTQKI